MLISSAPDNLNPAGGLDKNIQNAELDERSAIHGMVFDSTEEYLYSADMWANKIWCHKKVLILLRTRGVIVKANAQTRIWKPANSPSSVQ